MAGLLACLAAGCVSSHSGKPPFPIGIYGAHTPEDLAELRDAGFNFVVGPAETGFLDAAGRIGLKVLAAPAPGTNAPSAIQINSNLARFDRHFALAAWCVSDEPDLNLISPMETRRQTQRFRRAGARKPTALSLSQGYQALHYANLTDILMLNRYPVPWLPLANFGQHVEMARLAMGPERPLYAVIQAFDWSFYRESLSVETPLRPPSFEELRCMTYEALARGANGVFYYEFDGRWKMRQHPATWDALKRVVAEVNDRRPLFEAEELWWAREHDFRDKRDRFNAALQSSVSSRLLHVPRGNATITPGDYILAVNNTPRELTYGCTVPGGSAEDAIPVLGEGRNVEPHNKWVWDGFGPYAVHVYGPFRQSAGRASCPNAR